MSAQKNAAFDDTDRTAPVSGPTDRSFCITFAVVGAIFGLVSLWRGGNWWPYLFGFGGIFLLVGLTIPSIAAPLNRLWFKFGMVLHRIVSPLIMGMIFFVVFTPAGLLARSLGKDFLRLKRDETSDSYWIKRDPPGPSPDSMPHQF